MVPIFIEKIESYSSHIDTWHITSHPFKSKPVGYFLIFACRFHHLIQSELSLGNFRLVRQGLWLIETQMVETAG